MSTKIEWVQNPDGTQGKTWNPVTGCTPISEGCRNCYAKRMALRLAGRYGYPATPHEFDVTLHPGRLEQPLHWRKPRTVFVCSMSDLFHKNVPDDFIAQVFGIMATMKEHTFQVLTKRPARMATLLPLSDKSRFRMRMAVARNSAIRIARDYSPVHSLHISLPLPNVWLGVSVENQAAANERIPVLRRTPAALHYVSIEPMLSEIYIEPWLQTGDLQWIIAGGESGPGARPMHPDWAKSIRDQCQEAGVPFFFKQWGRYQWRAGPSDGLGAFYDIGKKRAGRLLDGREWNELPEVRQ